MIWTHRLILTNLSLFCILRRLIRKVALPMGAGHTHMQLTWDLSKTHLYTETTPKMYAL